MLLFTTRLPDALRGLFSFYVQIVFDLEDSRNGICADADYVLVEFIGDNALKPNIPFFTIIGSTAAAEYP
jgi:hypothetical protein